MRAASSSTSIAKSRCTSRSDSRVHPIRHAANDAAVISDLDRVHEQIVGVLALAAAVVARLHRYDERLARALERVHEGDTAAFARPMYDSYHDIWMELHQDLLLTTGRERGADDEG